ncbi:cellulase [Flammeovirgaceae bacterium 311]|nr:cellulase [Flammeovirgaceae bacterium 311]
MIKLSTENTCYTGRAMLRFCLLLLLAVICTTGSCLAQSIVEKHGQLQVRGNRIVDKDGNPVQLRGMSFFWSQWIGKYYNHETVKWLRDDWGCTVVRAAMAVDNGGYATNPDAEKAKVIAVVDAAIDLGIYVLIDFHVHEAHHYQAEALKFFEEMAQRYKDYPNVIYEPWNEPTDQSWATVIKPYHESVIEVIRKHDPDNIIVCGNRTWSQRVDEAAANPIDRPNIAYTLHYYANTHKQWLRDAAKRALDLGAALFVTEYGTTDASGDGFVNEAESKLWWAFLDQHKISHLNWSVADKLESSAALKPGASATGGWPLTELTQSGKLVRSEIRTKNAAASEPDPAPQPTGLSDKSGKPVEVSIVNPFSGSFNLQVKGPFSYQIYNEMGQMLEQGKGTNETQVGSSLKSGLYILKVQFRNKEEHIKLIKQ